LLPALDFDLALPFERARLPQALLVSFSSSSSAIAFRGMMLFLLLFSMFVFLLLLFFLFLFLLLFSLLLFSLLLFLLFSLLLSLFGE